jgi:hypothetical protein
MNLRRLICRVRGHKPRIRAGYEFGSHAVWGRGLHLVSHEHACARCGQTDGPRPYLKPAIDAAMPGMLTAAGSVFTAPKAGWYLVGPAPGEQRVTEIALSAVPGGFAYNEYARPWRWRSVLRHPVRVIRSKFR